jgi:hypothetical protein
VKIVGFLSNGSSPKRGHPQMGQAIHAPPPGRASRHLPPGQHGAEQLTELVDWEACGIFELDFDIIGCMLAWP